MKEPSRATPAARKRIVSARRSREPRRTINFRMTESELARLDAAARGQHLSRSDLIHQGLRRCMSEGVWTAGQSPTDPRGDRVSPATDVVALSQVLMGVSMALEGVVAGKRRSAKTFLEAAAILADAKRMLADLIEGRG